MGTVTELDAHRPHICLPTLDGNAHVLPAALLEDIIVGRTPIDALDDRDIIIRTIMANWLETLD